MHICRKCRCKPDEAVTDPNPSFASVLPDVQLMCSLAGHVNGQQPKLGDRGSSMLQSEGVGGEISQFFCQCLSELSSSTARAA